MDPNDYQRVQFDSFYAEAEGAAFSKRYAGTNYLAGGAALRLGDYYTALFFDGSGDDLFFGGHNSLYALIGTPSLGAFKPFYKTFSDESLFGVGWGMNFQTDAMLVKPEVMAGYAFDRDNTNGWKGYFNGGAALELEFAVDSGESSFDIKYELRLGVPAENKGALMAHYLNGLYRRLYDVTDTLQAGWFAGAGADYVKYEKQKRSYYERWDLTPLGGIGIKAALGDMFTLSGQLLSSYNMNHEEQAESSIELNITPVAGMAFTPYKGFKIEVSTSPSKGLSDFDLWNISLRASFKK
jgi:hypothetical protein